MAQEKKILIIEDDELIAYVIKSYLLKIGCNVIDTLTTGEEAIDMALTHKPDVIVSDIMLDGVLNGIEAVKEILKNIETDVIFMTSHLDPKLKKDAAETNYLDFLHKPVTFEALQGLLSD